ncbi:pseudouridine synthase [Wolbachia pipientis]|nr:pseudouridine synthase [Wolbachia pipientis]MDM8334851.1 pseudouridine synthase [Wolbachia pipientis]
MQSSHILVKSPIRQARSEIVHRLDKDTSGLMVIAKNEEAHSFLSELPSIRKIKREYLAVVWRTLPTHQGTIKTNIASKQGNKEMMYVTKTTGN